MILHLWGRRWSRGTVFVAWLILSFNNFSAAGANESDVFRLPVRIEGSPVVGNKNAPVTLVEFTDFECPFCQAAQPTIAQIRERYPDAVRLVFKNFPLPSHRNARRAHLAALCAHEQGKFWEYRTQLFQSQRAFDKNNLVRYAGQLGLSLEPFEYCLDQERYASKIEADVKEGLDLGVQGTPSFLINGRPLSGAQPFSSFERLIEDELARSS